MSQFIEVTEISPITRTDEGGYDITEYVRGKLLINKNDISRITGSTIILKTPYRSGDHYCTVSESYEQLKSML